MNKFLPLLLLICFLHFEGKSQQHLIDSIEKELATNIPDSTSQ